jgi:polyhydroxyalkanoate synthesis regulator phasin
MTDHKFTDEDIVKVLECCQNANCFGCPFDGEMDCVHKSAQVILDLINRQNAEIEEQDQAIIKSLKRMGEIRAEAIKEFADELEHRLIDGGIFPAFVKNQIDCLVKEMTEGE